MVSSGLLGLVWILAVVMAMFVFWRRVRAEVEDEELWRLMLKMAAGSLLMGRFVWWLGTVNLNGFGLDWWLSLVYFWLRPGIEIWGVLFGGAVVLIMNKKLIKNLTLVSEFGDAWVEAVGWAILIVISYQLSVVSLQSFEFSFIQYKFWRFMINLVGLLIWYGLRKWYRKWSWYPSGRVGFLWWAGLGLLGLGQAVMLFVEGNSNLWVLRVGINLMIFIVSVRGVYLLSGRKSGEDWHQGWKRLGLWLTLVKQKIRRRKIKSLSSIELDREGGI